MSLTQRTTLALLLVCLVGFTSCSTAAQRAKLEELQSLAAEIPKFPDFKQSRYSDLYKPARAVVTYHYESVSKPEQVRDFYVKELPARGWALEKAEGWFAEADNPLTFRKANYKIVVTHDDLLRQYSIDFVWSD
jgi:hypothetical protein